MNKIAVTVLSVSVILGVYIGFNFQLWTHQVDMEEYSEVTEIETGENHLLLKSGCWLLSMGVSPEQVHAIEQADIETPRPMTHDLLLDSLDASGMEPQGVLVHSLQDGSYRAALILEDDLETEAVDSRPSDAVALAARHDLPVYARDDLLENHGEFICEGTI